MPRKVAVRTHCVDLREAVYIALRRRALATGQSLRGLASDLISASLDVASEANPRPLPPPPVSSWDEHQQAWASMCRRIV